MLNFLDKSVRWPLACFHKYPYISRSYGNGATSLQANIADRLHLQNFLPSIAGGSGVHPQTLIQRKQATPDGI